MPRWGDEAHERDIEDALVRHLTRFLLDDAVFIGFTGTPLLKKDKKTSLEVFGGYIHTYKFSEAVEDGVVLDRGTEAEVAQPTSAATSNRMRRVENLGIARSSCPPN